MQPASWPVKIFQVIYTSRDMNNESNAISGRWSIDVLGDKWCAWNMRMSGRPPNPESAPQEIEPARKQYKTLRRPNK